MGWRIILRMRRRKKMKELCMGIIACIIIIICSCNGRCSPPSVTNTGNIPSQLASNTTMATSPLTSVPTSNVTPTRTPYQPNASTQGQLPLLNPTMSPKPTPSPTRTLTPTQIKTTTPKPTPARPLPQSYNRHNESK